MKRIIAIALLTALPGAAAAELQLISVTYNCERGVTVPVTYVNTDGPGAVVLNVEGRQVGLDQQISASGARYGPAAEATGYVWWSRGDEATLYWQDGETDDISPLHTACQAER